jgi:hypothetical protein
MRWSPALALAVALGAADPARADLAGAGTRAASFLQTGAAPAVAGMGGAGLASGADLESAAWNTAALAHLSELRWSVAHAALPDGVRQEWAGIGGRLREDTRWAVSGLYRDDGEIEARDADNRPLAPWRAQSVALSLALARPLGPHLALGAGARYVGEHVGDAHGNGLAFGAGVQVRLGGLRLAMVGQDFGGGMRWAGQQWRMPATLAAGLAWVDEVHGLRLAADVIEPAAAARQLRTGGEWRPGGRMALRLGWRGDLEGDAEAARGGATFGLGFATGRMWLDYGFEESALGEGVHRVGLSLAPGGRAWGGGVLPVPLERGAAGPAPAPTR